MKKVLIIEYDEVLLDVVDYILIGCGLSVYSFKEIPTMGAIIKIHPHLIIIDHLLKDGLANKLCLELKGNEVTGNIPVLLVSTNTALKNIAGESCADIYLSKPFDLNDFEKAVGNLLQT